MKTIISAMLFLLIHTVSYSQSRLRAVAGDTSIYAKATPLMHTFDAGNTFQNKQPIAPDLYTQHLPFFCRQELKMKQAHVPVTFRIGSIDQCNYLEQKPGYR